MADKRISQLIERVDIANNDVLPIVASGATTTNKVTISTLQDWMQDNLDVGVTSVGITIGSTGTDVSVSGSPITSSGNITINLPTASATNRGLLSAADWTTFNNKANAGDYVTLATTQTITAQKTFTTSGSSDTMIISHGSGSGFALDVLKAGNGEAIRVTKSSGTGNAMTISGGNFEAPTIVKTGGTSSQFLKADGSVDSNTYLTTGSAGSTYVPYSGATSNVDLGVNTLTSSSVILNGSGSNAGMVHLESNAIHSLVNGYGSIASGTTNQFNLYQTTGAGVFRGAILSLNSITASATRTYTLPDADGTLALTSQIPTNPVGGTGAAGRVAYWNGAGTITSDSLFQWNDTFKRLGIGRTPTVSLDVEGAGYFSGALGVGGALNGTSATFSGDIRSNAIYRDYQGEALIQTSGSETQIGTSGASTPRSVKIFAGNSPSLTIASTGAATFSSSVTATGNYNLINNPASVGAVVFQESGNRAFVQYLSPTFGTASRANSLELGTISAGSFIAFRPLDAEAMRITSAGNVGIGTASPIAQLQIGNFSNAFADIQLASTTAGYSSILFGDGSTGTDSYRGYIQYQHGGDYMIFASSATERMRITSGGVFKAKGSESTYHNINATYHELRTGAGGNWTTVISNTAGNPFGLDIDYNSSPNNTNNDFLYCTDGIQSVLRLAIRSNGGLANFQANDTNLSDERVKKDIEPLESYWDKFKAIEIVKFKYKDQTHDDFNIGVIAQQVEAVAPEFVNVDGWETKHKLDEEGNEIVSEEEPLKSIYTADLHHATIKVLQEAMEKIEKLETEIDSLKNQIK